MAGATTVTVESLTQAAKRMNQEAQKIDSETIKGILEKMKASADQLFKGEAKKAFDEVYEKDKAKILSGSQVLKDYASLLESLAIDYQNSDTNAATAIRKAGGG